MYVCAITIAISEHKSDLSLSLCLLSGPDRVRTFTAGPAGRDDRRSGAKNPIDGPFRIAENIWGSVWWS